MAKDRNGSVNIYGAMQAKTAEGIVAYTDGIAHENEDGTTVNLYEMLKNGVGGVSAIVDVNELPKPGWKGTAVPNSGMVEKVYLNTNLSIEEITDILNSAEQINPDGAVIYYGDNDLSFISVEENNVKTWYLGNLPNMEIYFASKLDGGYTDFVGWSPEFNGVIEINSEVESDGYDNSILSSLISTTPFTKEGVKDDVFYRVISRTEPVPDEGYIEKIYINTDKPIENINSILEQLPYVYYNGGFIFPICCNYNLSSSLSIIKSTSGGESPVYAIINFNSDGQKALYYSTSGWLTPNFPDGYVEIGYENAFSQLAPSFGVSSQNDKLSSIFSIKNNFENKTEIYSYKDSKYKKLFQEGENVNFLTYLDMELTSESSFSITEKNYNILKNNDNVVIRLKIVGTYHTDVYLLYKSNIKNESTITFIGISESKKIVCLQVLSNLVCNFSSISPKDIETLIIENNKLMIRTDSLSGHSIYSTDIDTTPTSSSKNLISSGAVYTALQSYAKTEDVNQMIAEYITTNFENFNEGEF